MSKTSVIIASLIALILLVTMIILLISQASNREDQDKSNASLVEAVMDDYEGNTYYIPGLPFYRHDM